MLSKQHRAQITHFLLSSAKEDELECVWKEMISKVEWRGCARIISSRDWLTVLQDHRYISVESVMQMSAKEWLDFKIPLVYHGLFEEEAKRRKLLKIKNHQF
jgi:hypothetical protein